MLLLIGYKLGNAYTQNVQRPLAVIIRDCFEILQLKHLFFEQNICPILLKIGQHKSRKKILEKSYLSEQKFSHFLLSVLKSNYYLWKFSFWKFSLRRIWHERKLQLQLHIKGFFFCLKCLEDSIPR